MRAVRVQRRAKLGGVTAHWLRPDDPERTLCGRAVAGLQVLEAVERDMLYGPEACHGCERVASEWAEHERERAPAPSHLQPSLGRARHSSTAVNTRTRWKRLRG